MSGQNPEGVTEILSFLRNLYVNELYAGVPFHFTPACVLVHFQRTAGQIIEHQHFLMLEGGIRKYEVVAYGEEKCF